jgi:hypothetical protein
MKVLEECKIKNRNNAFRWRPSVSRRFSAGHKEGSLLEGKGVNALTGCTAAEVHNPVVNDRGTEHTAPDRPHQKERTWSSVNWRPSVTRRFSAGLTDNVRPEGKGVNALTVCTAAEGRHPVVNDRGTECVSLRPSVPRWPSVPRRFSAGHNGERPEEGKGVNALIEYLTGVRNPVVNDRGTEIPAAGGRVSVVNDWGTDSAVCGGDLDYHTPSYFGNMLDLRTPTLQRRD